METKLTEISIYISPRKIKKLAGMSLRSLLTQFDNSGNIQKLSTLVNGVQIEVLAKNAREKNDYVIYSFSNGLVTSSKNSHEAFGFLPLHK